MGRENEWLDLWKNADFLRYYITGTWLLSGDSDLNNLAACYLKFDRTDTSFQKADSYFKPGYCRRAVFQSSDFGMAIIALVNGNDDLALANLKEAEKYDPASYSLRRFAKNIDSYKNSYDYRIYNIAANRRSVDFGPKLDALIKRIKGNNHRINQLPELHGPLVSAIR